MRHSGAALRHAKGEALAMRILWGPTAKTDRAIEQLERLQAELREFRENRSPTPSSTRSIPQTVTGSFACTQAGRLRPRGAGP